jgi:hypothetical protein
MSHLICLVAGDAQPWWSDKLKVMSNLRSQDRIQYLKRVIILGTLTCLCFFTARCISWAARWSNAAHPPAAQVQIAGSSRDLGRILCGSEHTVAFLIRNAGTRRLVINEIESACGCASAVGRTIIVPPGDSVDVSVTLRASQVPGPIERVANFTTNAPGTSRFQLAVRAQVESEHGPPRIELDSLGESIVSTK